MSRNLHWLTEDADIPCTLGLFLSRRGFPSGLLATLRQRGGVEVDGAFRRMIDPLHIGEQVSVLLPDERPCLAPNPQLNITVLYEDDDLAVLDKPDNILVHPAAHGFDDAVGNFWAAHAPTCLFRPIGRLDRHTTGVLLVARHQLAAAMLTESAVKTYLAVAEGRIAAEEGLIDLPLLRVPGRQIKRIVDDAGQPSRTRYRVLRRLQQHTLLELKLETGRTHQIRAHLAALGHPLAGDTLYGGQTNLIKRQALHCSHLCFTQPIYMRQIDISSPLPEDIRHLLAYG